MAENKPGIVQGVETVEPPVQLCASSTVQTRCRTADRLGQLLIGSQLAKVFPNVGAVGAKTQCRERLNQPRHCPAGADTGFASITFLPGLEPGPQFLANLCQ